MLEWEFVDGGWLFGSVESQQYLEGRRMKIFSLFWENGKNYIIIYLVSTKWRS